MSSQAEGENNQQKFIFSNLPYLMALWLCYPEIRCSLVAMELCYPEIGCSCFVISHILLRTFAAFIRMGLSKKVHFRSRSHYRPLLLNHHHLSFITERSLMDPLFSIYQSLVLIQPPCLLFLNPPGEGIILLLLCYCYF